MFSNVFIRSEWLAIYVHKTAPIGAWKWNFLALSETMTDIPTDQPTDRQTGSQGSFNKERQPFKAVCLQMWLNKLPKRGLGRTPTLSLTPNHPPSLYSARNKGSNARVERDRWSAKGCKLRRKVWGNSSWELHTVCYKNIARSYCEEYWGRKNMIW